VKALHPAATSLYAALHLVLLEIDSGGLTDRTRLLARRALHMARGLTPPTTNTIKLPRKRRAS
jgi:hypothetical protein